MRNVSNRVPDGRFPGYGFERGFVAHLRTDASVVASPDDFLFRLAPIEHLDLTPGGPIRQALTADFFYWLRSVGLTGLGLTDDDVTALAHRGRLDRCEHLDLRNNMITEAGVQAMAASEQVRSIRMVLLDGNPGWTAGIAGPVEERCGRIDWLHLAPTDQPDRFMHSTRRTSEPGCRPRCSHVRSAAASC